MKWLLACLIAAGLVTVAPSAQAVDPKADHRPCVSLREYRGSGPLSLTKRELERRWEVKGLGTVSAAPLDLAAIYNEPVVSYTYPRCAFSTDVAVYGVTYAKHNMRMVATFSVRQVGVAPQGHL